MASTTLSSIFEDEFHNSSTYRALGLVNGILIGLALALGTWGISAYRQISLPTRVPFAGLILAALLVVALSGFVGWVSARFAKSGFTVLLWLVAAFLAVLIIGFESNYIRTAFIWLADSRFWGLSVYPLPPGSILPNLIAGFFVFLMLVMLAFLQDYRLEEIYGRLGPNKAVTVPAIIALCLPLPFIVLAGYITNNIIGGANAPFAIESVNEVIQTGRTYEGDLFELSRREGINYNALRGVKDVVDGDYVLGISGFDPASASIIVTAEFENGTWIECRVQNEQVGFCTDASPPYTTGFATLITGEELPENCAGCIIRVDDTWRSWLEDRNGNLDADPQIEKVVQWGTYTLMRAESPDGDYVLECWFSRSGVIELESCSEVNSE